METFKRYIERTSLDRTVERVEVRNWTVLGKLPAEELKRAVEGSSFRSVRRHGKQLFLELSREGFLTWHFGMTGEPIFFDRPEDEPRYPRVLFHFEIGALAFDDPRMLGRIGFTSSIEEFLKRKKLGPDALAISQAKFLEMMGRSKGSIKPVLTDQHKLAGVGNIYADEVLFQSRIDPRTDVRRLSEGDWKRLYRNMRKVLRMAVNRGTDFARFPKTYLLHDRKKGAACPLCGGKVETVTLGGRTTYYCPACQDKGRKGSR